MIRDYSNQIYNDYEKALVKLDKIMDKLSNIEKEHKKEIKDLKDSFKGKIVSLYNKIDSLTIDLKETNKLNEKYLNKINELTLEIERLKNNNNKNSSNSSKPSSTNGYKKVIINNREKSNSKQGGQKGHKGSTLTQNDVDKMIDNDYNKFKERYLEILNKGKAEYNDSLKSNEYKEEERSLLNRLIKYVDNHLLFLKKFYVEFSNNQAETDLRPAKIKQKIGKFRSIEGAEIYAITRSCYSTYKKNKENIYNSLNKLLLKTKTR